MYHPRTTTTNVPTIPAPMYPYSSFALVTHAIQYYVLASLPSWTYLGPHPPPPSCQSAAVGRGCCRLTFATIRPNQSHNLYE